MTAACTWRVAAVRYLALALLVMAGFGGCVRPPEEGARLKLTTNPPLEQTITELWRHGGERPVAELVDVAFDELMVIPEGTPTEVINAAAGARLLNDKYYHSSTQLFLFRRAGVGVRADMVASDVFEHRVQNGRFGVTVRLIAPGGQRLMDLRD